ncbi:MAG: hypothetical protein IPM23_01230 [Candidatus Melainabacteria bacterium]|nr:hypothetical protein [Candidatus Melainabacteria bacterium]
MEKSSELDFSPFDADANLKAVLGVIKAIRHMSWSYAGDINRVAKKITQSFYAGRCMIFASSTAGRVDVFEYVEEPLVPVAKFFLSSEGQIWLNAFLQAGSDLMSPQLLSRVPDTESGVLPGELTDPPCHVLPLKNPYTSRHGVKPGFLLLQEPRGLSRWNRRMLESAVVVAEYLAMVIECERLTENLQEEISLSRLPGVLPRIKLNEYVNRELSRLKDEGRKGFLVYMGLSPAAKLSSPDLIRAESMLIDHCAREVVAALTNRELVGRWEGNTLVALMLGEDEEHAVALIKRLQQVVRGWCQEHHVGLGSDRAFRGSIASYPEHGATFTALLGRAVEGAGEFM